MQPRYLVVFGACLTQYTVIGLLFSYGVLIGVFEAEFGWSRTFLSSVSSLAFIVMGVLAMVGGRLSDRFGPRAVLSVTGLVYGLGFALIGQVTAEWQLLAIFGLMIGLGLSTHDVITLSTIARWFSARRGMMSGVVKVGTALGQMTLPLVAAFLIGLWGWRDAVTAMGLAAAALLLLAAQSMRAPDKPASAPGSGAAAAEAASGATFAEARASRAFWTICLIQFLFFPALMTVPLHIVVHGMDLGMNAGAAAGFLSVIGGASIAGRLAIGAFSDRIGGRNAYILCLTPVLIALLLLLVVRSPAPIYAVIALYGFGHGGLFTVVSPMVAETFGARAHGAIFGVVLFFGTIGGAIGPVLAGWSFDAMGGYAAAFTTLAAMNAAAILLAATLPGRPQAA